MGEPCALLHIARRARQYDVIHIMPRACLSATQRNGMLKMVEVLAILLLKSVMAVVASIMLQLQLVLYLRWSQCTFYCSFTCLTPMPTCTAYPSPMLCFRISTLTCPQICLVPFSVPSCLHTYELTINVSVASLICPYPFFMQLIPLLLSLVLYFFVSSML